MSERKNFIENNKKSLEDIEKKLGTKLAMIKENETNLKKIYSMDIKDTDGETLKSKILRSIVRKTDHIAYCLDDIEFKLNEIQTELDKAYKIQNSTLTQNSLMNDFVGRITKCKSLLNECVIKNEENYNLIDERKEINYEAHRMIKNEIQRSLNNVYDNISNTFNNINSKGSANDINEINNKITSILNEINTLKNTVQGLNGDMISSNAREKIIREDIARLQANLYSGY